MRNRLKRAAVLGLSACLVLSSAAGCSKKESFQPEAAAITVNGDEISAGLVKFATHYSQAMQEDIYKMYMGVSDPMSQDLYGNGSTMGDMIKAQTVATLENMVLAEQKMEEYGISLTDEEKASITEAAEAFLAENDEEVLEKVSATQETVERYLTLNLIQVKMEPALSADVDTEVSDEEAAQRKIRYALFRAETEAETEEESEALTEDASEAVSEADTEAAATEAEAAADTEVATEAETAADTETATEAEAAADTEVATEAETAALTEETDTKTQSADETETAAATEEETAAETETETEDPAMVEAKAEAFAKAEEMIAKVKAGEDFEAAAEEIDADAPCSELTFGSDSTSIVEGLITATEGLEDGTLVETPIEIDSGYYVAQVISKIDRDATDAKKEDIVEERKSDRVSELYTQWREEAEITENADVLALIVFDFSLTQQTEASTEAETEAATEAVTEAATEAATEAVTEAETEAATEAVTEAETEAATEAATEAVTEAETEAATEAGTEAAAEAVTEAATEAGTEAVTE